mgnify:CR=1 FL=1
MSEPSRAGYGSSNSGGGHGLCCKVLSSRCKTELRGRSAGLQSGAACCVIACIACLLAEFFQAFTASVNNNPPVVSYAIDRVLSPSAVPSKAHDGVSFRVVRAVFLSFENGGRLINVTLCL